MGWSRWMKWAAVTLGGLGLAGCEGEEEGLRAFDGSAIKMHMSLEPALGTMRLNVDITPHGCPSMGKTRAFFNGQEMTLFGQRGEPPGMSNGECNPPTFAITRTPRQLGIGQEVSRFEMVDGDVHRVIEGRWLLAPRALRWKSPAKAQPLMPGQEVRLEMVGPPGDALIDENNGGHAIFDAKDMGGPGWSLGFKKSAGEEKTVSGTVPGFARALPGRFVASVSSRAEILRCDHMEDCLILVNYHLDQELTPPLE